MKFTFLFLTPSLLVPPALVETLPVNITANLTAVNPGASWYNDRWQIEVWKLAFC